MKKRKEPESAFDELMPVDDLPGMALYFAILRAIGKVIGLIVEESVDTNHSVAPRWRWETLDFATYMMALAPVSAVAALWFVPRLIAIALRKVRRPGYYEREKARRLALAHERLSTRRRTTLNPIPTPEALLTQFGRIRRNPREMLVFGSMLEDLEAYVDNDLVRDDDGRIVGRHGGIKQWLNERCPELGKRYHTVMRYKALAKRCKQVIDLEDPVPVAYALAAAETPVEVNMEYKGVFFWHHAGPYGFLSNWYPAEFTIDGGTYRDTEQYFMAQKAIRFGDTTRLAEIMAAEDPATYKKLGRLVENYDPAVWNAVRYEVMKTGNRAKFTQHPDLRQKLLATGDALIAEASPRDCIWGIGYGAERARRTPPDRFRGQNLQGRLLMELREEFRRQ